MKINYAEIIKVANDRKDRLQELENMAEEAETQAKSLIDSLDFFTAIMHAYCRLDAEGKEMLGETGARIKFVGEKCQRLLGDLHSASLNNLQKLLNELK